MAKYIITGAVHSGKTTYAYELMNSLKSEGLSIGGFLSKGYFKDNLRDSFETEFLSSGKKMNLANRSSDSDNPNYFGEYIFNPECFNLALEEIKTSIESNKDIIFMDEIGRFEIINGGFRESLDYIKDKEINGDLFLVTRDKFINSINETFLNNEAIIIDISKPINESVNLIKANIKK